MAQERLALRVLGERLPGPFACRFHGLGRLPRCPRPPSSGGRPLEGRIRASGNKNGALPILAACLLTAEPVLLHNVPRIVDVETMIELLNDIGAEADWVGPNDVQVHASAVVKSELD